MKTVLILSYYFPPFNEVGGKRAYFFARYLSDHNFNVIVLKAENKLYGKSVDYDLIKKEKFKTIDVFIKPILKNKYLHWILSYFAFKNQAEKIIINKKIDVIMISGNPFYYFPLGIHFKKKYNVPYILDYRDNFFLKNNYSINKLLYLIFFKLFWDKPAIKKATYVINVTKKLTLLHQKENQKINKKKFVTIYNGYDDLVLKNVVTQDRNLSNLKVFKIGIFGKFSYYNSKHVDLLLNSVYKYNSTYRIKIHIYHIGFIEKEFIKCTKKYHIEKYIHLKNYKNYLQGIRMLSTMNCFILNNWDNNALSTKIFDYIYLNKPIIAFVNKDSEIAKLLSQFSNAFVVNFKEELIKALKHLIKNKNNYLTHKEPFVFSRSYQSKKLLDLIKRI